MVEIKETCYKGTRILLGNQKRELLNKMIDLLIKEGFIEISIPIIQFQETFKDKVGTENNNIMYNFIDRGDRDLCLAPEYTSVIQKLSNTTFKNKKNIKLFYIQECFRGEKPQSGRYRQFTQLGIEVVNPTEEKDWLNYLLWLSSELVCFITDNFDIIEETERGLDYYKLGKGFEIICDELGSSKQICGGGEYEGGIGFALGVDRIINLINK